MTYLTTCDGETTRITVVETAPGRYRVTADGFDSLVDFREPQSGLCSLVIDGRIQELGLDAEEKSDLVRVEFGGDRFEVELVDEKKKRRARKAAGSLGGRQEIKAPMAGNVWKVLVHEGDRVGVGQTVIILEAMKMENEIKAPIAGTVTSLSAREGVPVFAGDQFCFIEAPAEQACAS